MAVREMPRPCVEEVAQAQELPLFAKNCLTKAVLERQIFVKRFRTVTTQRSKPKGEERWVLSL
jgi:hypothetical protein